VDHSEPARAAVRLAARLARRLDGRLELVHVTMPGTHPGIGVLSAALAAAEAEVALDDVDILLRSGAVEQCLADASEGQTLLVIGATRSGPVREWLTGGGTTTTLTRRPRCPVVVVPRRARARDHGAALPGRAFVCGVADRVDVPCARTAAELADRLGLPFMAVHVRRTLPAIPVTSAGAAPVPLLAELQPPGAAGGAPPAVSMPPGLREHVLDAVEGPASFYVEQGSPAEGLLRAAAEHDAALLAMGATHHGPLHSALTGAPCRHAIQNGDRPVVVFPPARAA
jgi:nucleotide-binding universal stress UspA family protein